MLNSSRNNLEASKTVGLSTTKHANISLKKESSRDNLLLQKNLDKKSIFEQNMKQLTSSLLNKDNNSAAVNNKSRNSNKALTQIGKMGGSTGATLDVMRQPNNTISKIYKNKNIITLESQRLKLLKTSLGTSKSNAGAEHGQ